MQAAPSSQNRASDDALDIFIIAGEESGDRLGAALMAAIAAQAGRPVVFAGVGGHAMAAQGLSMEFLSWVKSCFIGIASRSPRSRVWSAL